MPGVGGGARGSLKLVALERRGDLVRGRRLLAIELSLVRCKAEGDVELGELNKN